MSKENQLRITEEEGDVVDIFLCPNKTPVAYARKIKELMSAGMTEAEAENCLLRPIPIELFYSFDQGLWGIEAECLSSCEVYDPYTGEEIPNDNLP